MEIHSILELPRILFIAYNESTGGKRDVTSETYAAVENLQKRIGWLVTIGTFIVIMILFLAIGPATLKRFDKIIGYKPQ